MANDDIPNEGNYLKNVETRCQNGILNYLLDPDTPLELSILHEKCNI